MKQTTVLRIFGQPDFSDHIDHISQGFGNIPFTSPGLAQGTSANTSIKAANTTTYMCGSVFCSKTTFEVAFPVSGTSTFTGANDIPPNASLVQEACYMISLNAAGTPTVTMGSIANGSGNALLPARPANGNTPIGYLRIAVAAGASGFEANTTQPVTAGAITATYVNGYPFPNSIAAQ